jgi:hypothetical protein
MEECGCQLICNLQLFMTMNRILGCQVAPLKSRCLNQGKCFCYTEQHNKDHNALSRSLFLKPMTGKVMLTKSRGPKLYHWPPLGWNPWQSWTISYT